MGWLPKKIRDAISWLRADDVYFPSDDFLEKEKARVESTLYPNHDKTLPFSEFLLAETKDRVTGKTEARRALEGKATAQITLLASIMGALAIFGVQRTAESFGPFLYASLIPIAISFVCCIAALMPVTTSAPTLKEYGNAKPFGDPAYLAITKAEYAIRMLIYSERLTKPNEQKGRCVRVSTISLVVAVALLMGNYLIGARAHAPAYTVKCESHGLAWQCSAKSQ